MSENDRETIENFDFTTIKLERGHTPNDIKDKCFGLCRDYLADIWLNVTIDDVEVKRLSGGLTNQLYYCAIKRDNNNNNNNEENINDINSKTNVPIEVAIRLYDSKHFNNHNNNGYERLTDTVVALIVSQNKLGPKLYGIFEQGQIQKYYKHRQFREPEQNDPNLVCDLATKLAQIHAMDVPIKKSGNWVFETFDNSYDEANRLFDLKSLYDECNCQTFKAHDLNDEIQWIKDKITELDSPIVFTHVDFRGSNIMVTDENDLILCDFEYSCYGYRGYDFGTLFAEWGKNFFDFLKAQNFPNDNTIKPFIDVYIEEMIRLKGKTFTDDKRNTFEHILKEIKLFTLAANMFVITLSIKSNESVFVDRPFDKKLQLTGTEIIYKNYHQLKNQFIESNAF
ncbi:choline/ethanolamine kinase-like [Oppia nitens]|uniref:choline/ethanolamine kinase-like n=1 Tax=Oppia nitens TaxID=1686743 RepID=UPI0023DA466E|nr:choline/ethanolamine kinase-like [Oppia nitens]